MLTPSELLNGTPQNYFPGSRLDNNNNIDIHIHTYVNPPPGTNPNNHNMQENVPSQSH